MATYQRGVVISGLAKVYGLVQRISKDTALTIAEAKDEDGQTADASQFEPLRTVDFEFVYDTDEALPDVSNCNDADVLLAYDQDGSGSGASENYLVEQIQDVEDNEEYRKVTIKGRRYLANGVPA